ncbi:desulfoferrodoxin [candidate division WOR-3 bacterium]|nr:desulfoferrodoxin [candidate division WOR-3 bacterium]
MAKVNEVYKCEVCGNIVEVLHGGAGSLVCCGKPMKRLAENSVDAAQEKHVPVVEKLDDGFLVKVGSVAHPMTEEHHIEWIELLVEGQVCRANLKPGDKPEARFRVKGENVTARAYCNLHGLWKGE